MPCVGLLSSRKTGNYWRESNRGPDDDDEGPEDDEGPGALPFEEGVTPGAVLYGGKKAERGFH